MFEQLNQGATDLALAYFPALESSNAPVTNMHDKFINPTKTLSLVQAYLHISGTAHTHLKGIAFLSSFKVLEQEKRILETEKCQTGNLWQAAQQGMVLVYLHKTSKRNNIHKYSTILYLGLRIV